MIELKNNKIRVRCLECKDEHFIEMRLINTDKVQRSVGFEYEYTYYGELACTCGENMKFEIIIWEYPKGIINYYESSNEKCLLMDKLTEDFFITSEQLYMHENYVNKQGKSKLSDTHMASLMYAIVICKARMLSTHGIGIYDLTKQQNRRHSYEFIISIDKNMIPKFQELTGIELKDTMIVYPT